MTRWNPVWIGVLLVSIAGGCRASKEYGRTNRIIEGSGGQAGAAGVAGAGGEAGAGDSIECEADERRCSELVPEQCSDDGQWQVLRAACAIACFGGACAECLDDTTQCRDGAVERCEAGVWATHQLCAATCEDGGCVDACTEDRLQCSGGDLLQRCTNGEYVDEQQCQYLCRGAACVGACAPDTKRCNPDADNEAQSCNADGAWDESIPCAAGSFCVDGACKPCQPDSRRCTEAGPQQCSSNGEWVNSGACSAENPVCFAGECVLCEPGSKRCADNAVEQCGELGLAWEVVEACTGETPACLQDLQICGKCIESDRQCQADVAQVCNAQGSWDIDSVCSGNTPQCVAGACTECDPQAGERSCRDDSTTQTCSSDGSWENPVACTGDLPLCRAEFGATCGCEENLRRCQDALTPEQCNGGTWVAQSSCSGTTPFCLPSSGLCVACEPADQTCISGVAHECDNSGAWQSLNSCSGSQVNCGGCDIGETCGGDADCNSGACVGGVCTACKPTQTQCSGNSLATCSPSGQWGTALACTDQTCLGPSGTAACSGECAPNQQRCNDNAVQNCNSAGLFAGSTTDCTALNRTCLESGATAACGGSCAPGQQRCNANQVQTCNANGGWSNTTNCTTTNEGCVLTGTQASCECVPDQCGNQDPTHCECADVSGACIVQAKDADTDGHGDALCAADASADDCNDALASAYPGAAEVCDGVDNDCNGLADLDDGLSLYGNLIELLPEAAYPYIAWSPESQRYGLVWQDPTSASADSYVRFSTLTSAGALLGTPLIVTPNAGGTKDDYSIQAFAWGADDAAQQTGHFGLVYRLVISEASVDSLYFHRIGSSGGLLGTRVLLSQTAGASTVSVARVPGGDWYVFWNEAAEARVARISGTGTLLGSGSIGNTGWFQATASNAAVALAQTDSAAATTFLKEFTNTLSGTLEGQISSSAASAYLAATQTHYGSAWQGMFREFTNDGSATPTCDAVPLPQPTDGGAAAGIAPLQSGWLVLYKEIVPRAPSDIPDLIRVGANCQPKGTYLPLAAFQDYARSYHLGFGNAGYAVVWEVSNAGANPKLRLRVLGPNLCDAPL